VKVLGVLTVAGGSHDARGSGVQFDVTGNSLDDLEHAREIGSSSSPSGVSDRMCFSDHVGGIIQVWILTLASHHERFSCSRIEIRVDGRGTAHVRPVRYGVRVDG
jgi:hypothetical protein